MNDEELKELAKRDKFRAIFVYSKQSGKCLSESKKYIDNLLNKD